MDHKLPVIKSRDDFTWIVMEEVRTADVYYKIEVSNNYLIGLLTIKSLSGKKPNISEITSKIKSTKFVLFDLGSIYQLLENITHLIEVKDVVIAKGVPSKHGKDAKIKVAFGSMDLEPLKNDVAQVDYKETKKIVSVKAGSALAMYIKETDGENGTDVFGHPIVAHKGTSAKFIASKNVILDEVSMTIKATVDGIPSSAHGVFKVEPALMIEKNVDLNVGNISFTGSISINGDILDGFKVHADGDIYIRGVIGACEVSSPGNIIVHGGITGKGKCVVKSKALQARFIHDAYVEVEDKILIQKEAIGSTIYCNGSLEAGVVIGGRVIVRDSIEVTALGSEQNVETLIDIGVDIFSLMKYESAISALSETEVKLKKELELFQTFVNYPAKFGELAEDKKNALIKLFENFKVKVEERKRLESNIHDCLLEFRVDKQRKKKILVNKLLNENVKFNSQFAHKKTFEVLKGPMIIKEDLANSTFFWTAPL